MSEGKLLHGQQYEPKYNFCAPFTQRAEDLATANPKVGVNPATDIAPIDGAASQVKAYDLTVVGAALAAYKFVTPGKINLDLPLELTSITLVEETTSGDGANSPSVTGSRVGTESYMINVVVGGESQASGSRMLDLALDWKNHDGNDVLCTFFSCFVAIPVGGILTRAVVLAKIKTLNATPWSSLSLDWPDFRPAGHTIVLTGRAASVKVGADVQSFKSSNGDDSAYVQFIKSDHNTSHSKQVTVKSVSIPPSIHGALSVSPPGNITITATTSAAASGSIIPSVSTGTITGTATISSQVSPSTLASTGGDVTVPASGVYVKELHIEPYAYGYALITGVVVDFADV